MSNVNDGQTAHPDYIAVLDNQPQPPSPHGHTTSRGSLSDFAFLRKRPAAPASSPAVTPRQSYRQSRAPSVSIAKTEAYNVMANHLYSVAQGNNWFSQEADMPRAVALRLAKNQYTISPPNQEQLEPFEAALCQLNCGVAVTYNAPVVQSILRALPPFGISTLQITPTERIQVVDDMTELGHARKAQQACFVRNSGTLVIWANAMEELEPTVEALSKKLILFVWNSANSPLETDSFAKDIHNFPPGTPSDSPRASFQRKDPNSTATSIYDEKSAYGEEGPMLQDKRRTNMKSPLYTGLAVALNIVVCGVFVRQLLTEFILDGGAMRLALLIVLPFQFLVLLFVTEFVINIVAQILLPISHMQQNTLFYSGKKPIHKLLTDLPHITIIIPVYKEGLKDVLKPTIESCQRAISTYELQGGTASILMCEDGMQVLDAEAADERRDYYDAVGVAWAARPGHGVDGYVRRGRFKKSSNLNSVKTLSLRVEEIMDQHRPKGEDWYQSQEEELYESCLDIALKEEGCKMWAEGNIRIGDIILLLDSDSRIPQDCFLDAATEMELSPAVGILQHVNGAFLTGSGYFEKAMAFFVELTNFAISWTVANGSSSPMMGHSAFLRWSAMQEQSFLDPEDNNARKFWSETHVSEDFVLALKMLETGYITRWCSYSDSEFKEGVSLTCDDEVNRWQKYAYGCFEIIFNPFSKWFTRSPFSPLFRKYLWSDAPVHTKFATIGYMFSYFGLAVSVPYVLGLYFVQGFFFDSTDPAWLPPFSITLTTIVVFVVGGNLAQIISRCRAMTTTPFRALVQHVTNLPLFAIFFNGLAWHVLLALFAYLVGYNMTWSATNKDLQESTVFKEIPLAFKRFWVVWLVMGLFLAIVIVLSTPLIPLEWRITDGAIIFPGVLLASMHILYPILLNPFIVLFNF